MQIARCKGLLRRKALGSYHPNTRILTGIKSNQVWSLVKLASLGGMQMLPLMVYEPYCKMGQDSIKPHNIFNGMDIPWKMEGHTEPVEC